MNAARVSSPRATRARRASQAPVSSGDARLATGSASMSPMPVLRGDELLPVARHEGPRGSASQSSPRASRACPGPSRAWRRADPRRRCRAPPTPSRPAASPPCAAAAGASACVTPRTWRPGAAPPRAAAASASLSPSASAPSPPAAARLRAHSRRVAELRDLLPAGDEPHAPARVKAIGRRRQRRHERLVGGRALGAARRGRGAPPFPDVACVRRRRG